ncbi:hypothetical protein ACZ90_45730 [Streptomyces albus subsp. albus]|nr:hypothetical protein ACZ90_45730 [Streptomyces albus subsp. albus]
MRIRTAAFSGLLAAAAVTVVASPASAAGATITPTEYGKIKLGSTISQMHSTAGSGACKKYSESRYGGHTYKSYQCKGSKTYSVAQFDFDNGKAYTKAQAGLIVSNGKMTKAKYDKLKKGDSVATMHRKAGSGVCVRTAESKIAGHTGYAYQCDQASTHGSAWVTFADGKLNTKSQSHLR